MEVSISGDQEILLNQLAERTGRGRDQIVKEALSRYLEHESWFAEAVETGRTSASRDDLIDHDEIVTRFETRFGS